MAKSLMRSLGEFVGHVARGFKTPIGPEAQRQAQGLSGGSTEVVRTVEEATVDTPRGQVTLRRTTIDEVVRSEQGQV